MPKPKKTAAKKSKPAESKAVKTGTMTIVCEDHHKCLKFAKDVKTAALKIKGKDGVKLRKLAAGFIPG